MFHRSKPLTLEAALRDMSAKDSRARLLAAETLGYVQDEDERDRAFEALAQGIGDARPEVRTTTCYSLANLERQSAWELIVLCVSDEVPEVRQSALIALGTLAASESFDDVAQALKEGSADVRFQAATSLCEIDAPKSYKPLLHALQNNDDAEVLGAIAISLAAIANPACIPFLAKHLEHPASQTRFDVAYALAQLNDDRGLNTLVASLTDTELGWDAVMALESLGSVSQKHLGALIKGKKGALRTHIRASGALLAQNNTEFALFAQECLLKALRARKIEHRGLVLQQLQRCMGTWAKGGLLALHKSFRGRHLREEIDELLQTLHKEVSL